MTEVDPNIRWVRIAGFADAINARITSGHLESEGIPVIVLNEHVVTANWLWSMAVGGVQLLVPSEHAERAKRLLQQQAAGEFELDDESDALACPHCGHRQWRRHLRGRHIALAVLMLTSVPLPFLGDQWRCAQCGQPQPESEPSAQVPSV